jgi:hypothetical protein
MNTSRCLAWFTTRRWRSPVPSTRCQGKRRRRRRPAAQITRLKKPLRMWLFSHPILPPSKPCSPSSSTREPTMSSRPCSAPLPQRLVIFRKLSNGSSSSEPWDALVSPSRNCRFPRGSLFQAKRRMLPSATSSSTSLTLTAIYPTSWRSALAEGSGVSMAGTPACSNLLERRRVSV